MTQECHVRFCERLKVKFHGPTYLSRQLFVEFVIEARE